MWEPTRKTLIAASVGIVTYILLAAGTSSAKPQVMPMRKRQDDFSLQLEKARRMTVSGDYEGAVRILERLDRERPEILVTSEMLAVSYIRSGRAARAVEFIEEKLKSHPGNFSLIKNLGLAYLELGDRRGAVRAWRRLISENEKKPIYYGVVSRLERENGLYEEAVETLREGMAFESYRARYTRELVNLLKVMGRERDAFLEAFGAVVSYGDGWGWNRLRDAVDIFRGSKRKGALLELADSLISTERSKSPVSSVAYALLLVEDGRFDRAYGEIESAISKKGAREYVYRFLETFASGRKGKWSEKENTFFESVLALFSKNYPDAPETAGMLLLKAKMERDRAERENGLNERRLRGVLDTADRVIESAKDGNLVFQARTFKARVLMEDLHSYEEALKVLEDGAWPSRGDSLVAAELVSKALIGAGDWDGAERFFATLKEKGDSTFVVLASFEEGLSLFYRGRYDEALEALSGLAKRYPWSRWANDALDFSIMIKKAKGEPSPGPLDLYRKALLLEFRGGTKRHLVRLMF